MEIVAQQVGVLAAKPDNPNTIPGTYSQLLQVVPWLSHAYNTHALFQINKEMLKNKNEKKYPQDLLSRVFMKEKGI